MIKSVSDIAASNATSKLKIRSVENKASIGGVSIEELGKIIPPGLKAKGRDKITQVVQGKVDELSAKITPKLSQLADKLGIDNIGGIPPTFPKVCPTPKLIEEVLRVRNNIVTKINSTIKYISLMTSTLVGFNTLVRVYNGVVRGLIIAKRVQLVVVAAQVPVVGATVAAIQTQTEVLQNQQAKAEKLKANVDGLVATMGMLRLVLFKIIQLLNKIDTFLKRCMTEQGSTAVMTELLPESQTIQEDEEVSQNQNNVNTTYNGFILEILKKPGFNGLTQSVGVAKNQSGIILLQTEPSFTLNPQSLIDELKIKIDSENLTGY